MSELITRLLSVAPRAAQWAAAMEARVLATGRTLTLDEMRDATQVGVRAPERIRIALVSSIEPPEDPELRAIAAEADLFGSWVAGLTLGYAVLIVIGHENRRLLSHEFRHVCQYEQAGSIEAFLAEYLEQIATVGYAAAPLELDACAHEIL